MYATYHGVRRKQFVSNTIARGPGFKTPRRSFEYKGEKRRRSMSIIEKIEISVIVLISTIVFYFLRGVLF